MQDAHTLIEEGKLLVSKNAHVSLRKLTLICVDRAPNNIHSLDSRSLCQ
ncbi:hypothetical protein K661_03229 [Piscirickettsia salmonis LF-89 = ATCC VR-1361]|nr:hypothetical protein K661_03229 [Piscirickettsia salmonis LF-89 = ATCC VR-1361]